MNNDVLIPRRSPFFAVLKLLKQGDFDAVVTISKCLLLKHPTDAYGHYLLALGLVRKGQLEEAEHHYREAIRYDNGMVTAYLNLSGVLCSVGAVSQASDILREGLELHPGVAILHYVLATMQERQGEDGAAETGYREALRCDPTCARAHVAIGRMLQRRSDQLGARIEFESALKIEPENVDALTGVATIALNTRALCKCLEVLRREVSSRPEDAATMVRCAAVTLSLALKRMRESDCTATVSVLDRALALVPDDFDAQKMRTIATQLRSTIKRRRQRRFLFFIGLLVATALLVALSSLSNEASPGVPGRQNNFATLELYVSIMLIIWIIARARRNGK